MRWRILVLGSLLLASLAVLFLRTDSEDPQLTPIEVGATGELDIRYASHSDRNRLDVYAPATPGPHPTIIWFHPGGWIHGDKAASMPVWDWTDRGYAVVAVNYRYATAPDTVAESTTDAIAATEFIVANHANWELDLDRIGVFGFSAGGHLAAMVATTDLPIAAVAIAGAPTDFAPMLDLTDPFFDGRSGTEVAEVATTLLGCSASTDCDDMAARSSPAQLVARDVPYLIAHGESDHIVHVDNANRHHAHLEELGIAVDLVIVPDGGHSPHMEEAEIDRFFDDHLLRE